MIWHFPKNSQRMKEKHSTSKSLTTNYSLIINEKQKQNLIFKIFLYFFFYRIASRLGLKSRSHNTTDGSRYIVIFKKLELADLANEILNNGLRSKCYELIAPTEPLPEKSKPERKVLPPHLQQRKANKIGFNYAQQNRNQHPAPKQNNKRKKFF